MTQNTKDAGASLKPCPFCGSDATMHHDYQWYVKCNSQQCSAVLEDAPMDEVGAAAAWNRRAPTAEQADLTLIRALQKALAYWMPKVFDDRSAHDAYLLVGYDGADEQACWGDEMVAATQWTPVGESLPAEPGWYLAMLAPENDWGLMSDTALQVEFDAYTNKPKAFTCFYDYRGDEDITAAVIAWMRTPALAAPASSTGDQA